jgi:hypothetical protein
MIKIRKKQYKELAKVTLKQFEEEMVGHLKKYFPKYCQIYGEPLIRKVIQYGIECAEGYGFLTKRDTPLYIDLMLLLGSHYDQDPQYPWARQILSDKAVTDPIARADRLYDRAVQYLDEAAGKENEYLGRALLRIRQIPLDQYSKDSIPAGKARMASLLQDIWPQKCGVLGPTLLNAVIEGGEQAAQEYNMPSERGVAVMTAVQFILGSRFDYDIQFPWASVLKDEAIQDPTSKVDGLYKAAIAYMNQWLS